MCFILDLAVEPHPEFFGAIEHSNCKSSRGNTSIMLDELPLEILTLIANLLPASSLRALSHVSSRIYLALVPELYRDLTFCAISEWTLNILDIDSFFLRHGSSRVSSYLQHTKNLHIETSIYLARFNRCAYYSIFCTVGLSQSLSILGASKNVTAHKQFLEDITVQLQLIFSCFKANKLVSFRWRLGICIPMGILNQGGYLSRHQKSFACLSLVMDGICPQIYNHLDGLSELLCLKRLEWEGIQYPAESNFSLWDGVTALLPLSILLLSKVTLPLNLSLCDCLIFRNLCVLKLRDCSNQFRLLRNLSRYQIPLQLEQFESYFLLSFHRLQYLHLRLSNLPSIESRIQDVIRYHQSILETIIYHKCQLISLDNDGLFEEVRNILMELYLRSASICPQLQLLHLRFSGSERIHRKIR
ncbi:unnamed protein product [Penicillium salamii]|uniref:F-box domain-containing protein n=1 Tax=Penicillium salamii TaxID=1612424 RepID=A0A9W4I490_9EURO|nr:unnamed protein product [Penicillium salamii]